MRPMYNPIIPMRMSWMPPRKATTTRIETQPRTTKAPASFATMAAMPTTNASKENKNPQ